MARFSFNSNDAPAMSAPSRGPLPPGQYEVIITKSDIKARCFLFVTRNSKGSSFGFEIGEVCIEQGSAGSKSTRNLFHSQSLTSRAPSGKLGLTI